MITFKKTVLRLTAVIALMSAAATPSEAQITKGEKSLGPKIGYVSKNQSAYAGLVFQYAFSEKFRLSPEIGYVFRHKDMDAFVFDLNAHVPFSFTGEKATFYPLTGLNYSSWSRHFHDITNETDDVTTRTGRFGLNVGAGFDLRCTESLKLSLEAKYCLMKGYTTAVVTVGIAYVF